MAHRSRLSRGMSANYAAAKASAPFFIHGGNSRKIFKHLTKNGYMSFFAERGLIHIIDEKNDGDYKPCSRKEFLLRAKNFQMARNRSNDCDEKHRLQCLIEDMIRCCEMAKHQGDPDQPGVMRQMKHERRHIGGLVNHEIRH